MFDIQPQEQVTIEHPRAGRPHEGKVVAAVQAHADDIPFFCAGLMAKLVREGYRAYLIQTTNDENCGPSASLGETMLQNEREVERLAEVLGFEGVHFLGYRNHRMDDISTVELRCRLIWLFRALRVDTVTTFNPWGHGEENPDHWVTAQAVEAACWMAGMDKDYPEQFIGGVAPHAVQERYYWVARPGQPHNRVVDISAEIEAKLAALSVNKAQGPAGATGSRLRDELAARGLRLPLLDGDDEQADRAYIARFMLPHYRRLGRLYGLDCAEAFWYEGPTPRSELDDYVARHAQPLG